MKVITMTRTQRTNAVSLPFTHNESDRYLLTIFKYLKTLRMKFIDTYTMFNLRTYSELGYYHPTMGVQLKAHTRVYLWMVKMPKWNWGKEQTLTVPRLLWGYPYSESSMASFGSSDLPPDADISSVSSQKLTFLLRWYLCFNRLISSRDTVWVIAAAPFVCLYQSSTSSVS